MDYATKGIILAIVIVGFYFLLAQFELLEGLFSSVIELAKSIIEPIKNILGNFI